MFFKKKSIDWESVAGQISENLLALMQVDMASLAQPYARFVLRSGGRIYMCSDYRKPQHLLGWGDIAVAFIRQDEYALKQWVDELKRCSGSPKFQVIATETFAKTMVREMTKQVKAEG